MFSHILDEEIVEASKALSVEKKMLNKKKIDFNPTPEDLFPIYKDNSAGDFAQSQNNMKMFYKTMQSFPFVAEDVK